jgi:hypothetical protein
MAYHLHACLKNGLPMMQVVNAESGRVSLDWSYDPNSVLSDKKQLQDLFRDLLLITMRRGERNARCFSLRKAL